MNQPDHVDVHKMIQSNGDAEKAKIKVQKNLEEATILRQDRASRLVKIKKDLKECRLRPGANLDTTNRVEFRKEDSSYWQVWNNPCHKFMKRFMPEKEKPDDIYLSIRLL